MRLTANGCLRKTTRSRRKSQWRKRMTLLLSTKKMIIKINLSLSLSLCLCTCLCLSVSLSLLKLLQRACIHAFVVSSLDYCCAVYDGLPRVLWNDHEKGSCTELPA